MRIRILLAAAALAAVGGCGGVGGTTAGSALPATGSPLSAPATSVSSGPTPSTTAPPTSTGSETSQAEASSTSTAASRCHTSELSASLAPDDSAAGQRYAILSLTNTARRTCTIFGYGGLQPLDAAKRQLPITLTRDTGRAPRLIRLTPGTSVGRTVHWGAVPSGTQPCPTPAYASIIPPDETDPLVIGWSLGPVCGGSIDGWPYGVTL